jgi:hypothetical protein
MDSTSIEAGLFSGSNMDNAPDGTKGYIIFFNLKYNYDNGWVTQVCFKVNDITNNAIYVRNKNGNSNQWSSWRKI